MSRCVTAAVADWRPDTAANNKLKKHDDTRRACAETDRKPGYSGDASRTRRNARNLSSALPPKRTTSSPMPRPSARAKAATGSSPMMWARAPPSWAATQPRSSADRERRGILARIVKAEVARRLAARIADGARETRGMKIDIQRLAHAQRPAIARLCDRRLGGA